MSKKGKIHVLQFMINLQNPRQVSKINAVRDDSDDGQLMPVYCKLCEIQICILKIVLVAICASTHNTENLSFSSCSLAVPPAHLGKI